MDNRPLRIAVQPNTPFIESVRLAGHEPVILPLIDDPDTHRALASRLNDGQIYRDFLRDNPCDVLLDMDISGLTFLPDADDNGGVQITTELCGLAHLAHLVDPVTSVGDRLDWAVRWQWLERTSNVKWVWDHAHARELERLGVPNVLHAPLAAPDGDYPAEPLEPISSAAPLISFIGMPATSWFRRNQPVQPQALLPGMLAAGVHADMPALRFLDVYADLYGLAKLPQPDDTPALRAAKAAQYFNAKFAYNAYLALKQRDRFVLFLKNKLPDQFELVGEYWDIDHGLTHSPRINGRDNITRAFRSVPICLNLIKGNAETGLNFRHFEITAAGGFMLTYKHPELESCFTPGKECAIFENEADLLDKIRYYTSHDQERIDIALAGQRRTLTEHRYHHRLQLILGQIGFHRTSPQNQPV